MDGQWVSITEYSLLRGISVSTIRRYIKGGQLQSKSENGKYLIHVSKERMSKWNSEQQFATTATPALSASLTQLKIENEKLKEELLRAREELVDLEMLTRLYESKLSENKNHAQ